MFKFEKSSLKNQQHCNLLPSAMGEKVIKVDLACDKTSGETARAILFVTPNGFVREHSHAKGKNPDSELYLNLLDIANNGIGKITATPEVAGSNSPTGRLEHGIAASKQPQIYLAIKKSQNKNAWQDFSQDLPAYLHSLRFGCSVCGQTLNLVSNGTGKQKEFVVVDIPNMSVKYFSSSQDRNQECVQEAVSLDGLTHAQSAFSREK